MGAHDEAYVRYYVKFAADAGYWHHFVGMSGTTDPKPWPMGKAGLRPSGTDRFGSGLEPDGGYGKFTPPGRWIFYTYWCEMRSWQGPSGTQFYGNSFTSPEPILAPRDKWICCERMIRLNSATDKADGAQAFWIDGKLAGWWGPGGDKGHWVADNWVPGGEPWPGFLWRKTMDLKINQFTLSSYVSDNGFKNTDEWSKKHPDLKMNSQEAVVSFDEIVMAKRYVGPILQAKKPAAEPESKPAGAAPRPPNGSGTAEAEAGKLFQMARQAEQMGQRDVARKLYAQVVEKYPDTEAAKQAKSKLN